MVTRKKKISDARVVVATSPQEAIHILREKKFAIALVAGGGMLNVSYMNEHLVDELFLDVEPLIFGKGIKLFSEGNFDAKLEFLKMKKLSQHTLQLHYLILK